MEYFKKVIIPIFLVGIWINVSETIRWLLVIETHWIDYYNELNLVFPNGPSNAITWMIWGFVFATIVFIISKKFKLFPATFICWFAVFVTLWIVLWNIDILPVNILWYNIPLSLLETYIAVLICNKLA